MKHRFRRFLSGISAIAVMLSTLPSVVLTSAAEEETSDDTPLLYGDINQDLVINSDDTTALSQAINNKTASELINADLNGDGKVNNSDALLLSQYVSGEITYFPVGDYYEADVTFVTRAEWIHNLVTAFDMSVDDTSTVETYFTDLSENEYADEIELAANFGVFEVESQYFNPNSMVTREFAAHTANFCAGYLNESKVDFADTDSICYEDDASVAVIKGWFSTVDNQFRPDLYIKSDESALIMADLTEALDSVKIQNDAPEIVKYSDSVIQIDSSVNAELNDTTLTINDEDISILAGNVFTINIDGTDCLFKAQSVSIGSNGETIVEVEDAALEEAVSEVDIQGYGEVDYNNITYYGDDTVSAQSADTNSTSSFTLPNVQYLAGEPSVNLNKSFDIGGINVKLSGSLSNIQPEYKLQYDGKEVQSFYLNVNADANFTATVSGEFTDTKSKEVKIAALPVSCGGVLTAEIGVYVTVSLSGEISVSYSWDVTGGVSYTQNGGWRTTKNFHKKSFTLDAKASESIAIKASVAAKFATVKMAEAYIMVGEKGLIEAKKREDGTECVTLKAYLFAEFGANANLFDLKTFSKSWEFINENNSPIKITRHWENDVLVDKCSYEDISSGTTGIKKKSYNYRDYSKYGLEFDEVIRLSNSAESQSDGTMTTITEDLKLTSDMTITGSLTFDADVDLNEHTLTICGDLIHIGGVMFINGGTLDVKGDYEIQTISEYDSKNDKYSYDYGTLRMEFAADKVNVAGDFIMKSGINTDAYSYLFDEGIIAINGHFYQYNSINGQTKNFYSTGTAIEFVGEGTHEIYFESGDSRLTQLIVPDDAKVKFTGHFRGFTLTQDLTIYGDTTFNSETLDLNGHTLTIEGNLYQTGGTISVNGGTLDVKGNYAMENTTTNNVGETEYNSCSAKLYMKNELDIVNISGDFTTHSLSSSSSVLFTKGTLIVSGDIWSDDGISTTSSYGHKTILNGEEK